MKRSSRAYRRAISGPGLVLAALVVFAAAAGPPQSPSRKPLWHADHGDGTYRNPVLFADYSDPDAIRAGDDFYLTSSSFNCAPGLPILHSKDLVNWRIIGHVFQQQSPREVFCKPQHGNGVWAPALRYHNGEFFVVYGDPDYGIYVARAKNPAGPWSPPHLVRAGKGLIDPCPFWDDDGKAYLVHAWARSRAGINSVLTMHRMEPDASRLLDDGVAVFDGRANHPTIEGPKLYKRSGYYYIFAPAGGVTSGWQTVLRAKNILGPYEDRIVMDQGKTAINGPHQGAWVELASGEHWFIHFQDRGAYGRVTHLQPMKWVNDWPVIGEDPDGDGKGQPVLAFTKPSVGGTPAPAAPATSDEFSAALGLQWQWHANFEDSWFSLTARRGWLRLAAVPVPAEAKSLWGVPNLLLQKFPAPEFTVTARLDAGRLAEGEKSGLLIMGMDYSYVAVERSEGRTSLRRMDVKDAPSGAAEAQQGESLAVAREVYLRVQVREGAVCSFSYGSDGVKFTEIGAAFQARAGRWIGAKVGLFALAPRGPASSPKARGHADYDWFRVE